MNCCLYLVSTEVNSSDEEEEATKPEEQQEEIEIVDVWFPDQAFAANKNSLIEVEELEEKIFAASLQVKVCIIFPCKRLAVHSVRKIVCCSKYFFHKLEKIENTRQTHDDL
jgi:hypothetical protein